MNELNLIIKDGIETVDSREVAKMVDMQHKDLLKKIRNYEQILLGAKLRSVDFFIPDEYQDSTGRYLNCYLVTKKGCDMIANKLTGEKGVLFTAKYITVFEQMKEKIQTPRIPTTDREILMLAVKVQEETAKRVDVVEEKIEYLENNMTIDTRQQYEIRERGQKKVIAILGGYESVAYERMSRILFSSLWGDYKRYFRLTSYKDTLKSKYDEALEYIEDWRPSINLEKEIRFCNNQIEFENL